MRKNELESLLAASLKLDAPRFKLQKHGAKFSGHIISDSFRSRTDSQRQKMIWDALEGQLGPEAAHQVGTLLAYTNDEWGVEIPAKAG